MEDKKEKDERIMNYFFLSNDAVDKMFFDDSRRLDLEQVVEKNSKESTSEDEQTPIDNHASSITGEGETSLTEQQSENFSATQITPENKIEPPVDNEGNKLKNKRLFDGDFNIEG